MKDLLLKPELNSTETNILQTIYLIGLNFPKVTDINMVDVIQGFIFFD